MDNMDLEWLIEQHTYWPPIQRCRFASKFGQLRGRLEGR